MNDLTAFQQRLIKCLQRRPNQIASIAELGIRMNKSFLAIYSSVMALERLDYLCTWRRPPGDRWSPLMVGGAKLWNTLPKIPEDLPK